MEKITDFKSGHIHKKNVLTKFILNYCICSKVWVNFVMAGGLLRSVPPENHGRNCWQFLGKWQFFWQIFVLWQFGKFFFAIFKGICAIFNVFSAHPRDGRFFFNLQKKI